MSGETAVTNNRTARAMNEGSGERGLVKGIIYPMCFEGEKGEINNGGLKACGIKIAGFDMLRGVCDMDEGKIFGGQGILEIV